jgi:putative transposase
VGADVVRQQLARFAEQPDGHEKAYRLLAPYRKRMNDISIFFKELKGRFAPWYNSRHGRYGVLWAERFKSLLLEGGRTVATLAAYIVLNPVRAALCADPKEYRYCGYAEALAKGCAAAQERLRTILGLPETTCWEELLSEYRKHLFLRGALATNQHGPAFDLAKAQEVVEQEKGELSLQEQLRCKIRYFSDGVILGSRAFVESHCQRLKEKLGYNKRKSGPIPLKILGPAALWVFRNPRVGPSVKTFPGSWLPGTQQHPAGLDRHRVPAITSVHRQSYPACAAFALAAETAAHARIVSYRHLFLPLVVV